MFTSHDSFHSSSQLSVGGKNYTFFSIVKAAEKAGVNANKLPISLKIILENMLRNENGIDVSKDDISALLSLQSEAEVYIKPHRVLLQDFTGVPVLVDLSSMRSYLLSKNKNPSIIDPQVQVDLVIDHSVQVDSYGSSESFKINTDLEVNRNLERYKFLKWGQKSFKNFSVVPPGTGICHQANIEYLASIVAEKSGVLIPDTLVGTDSHTTMVNSMCVLGWGVGGIEAESVMLGQYISMVVPEVIGVKLHGKLPKGATGTDLVLTITNILRKEGVVNKFVEFFGTGLDNISMYDRATIANMAPECGSTCNFFPADQTLLDYLDITGRKYDHIELVESYTKAQGFWRSKEEPTFSRVVEIDLSEIRTVIAGPKRPQDKLFLNDVPKSAGVSPKTTENLSDGSIIIAAITSCTNTSNPKSMIMSGLIARNAIKHALKVKPWVKTSFAPGSQVVTDYMHASDLQKYLDELGFNLVGYGCTTCIGNSGPLNSQVHNEIVKNKLSVASVLSGNRNFEGRIHPLAKYNYLASPPLVVAYALAGNICINLETDSLGKNSQGKDIYLSDIWPSEEEAESIIQKFITRKMFIDRYSNIFNGDANWKNIQCGNSVVFDWDPNSTYIQNPPYFDIAPPVKLETRNFNIKNARILALLGNSITTDHISPAGDIPDSSSAGKFLKDHGCKKEDFNSYGARRGNHHVMVRGTLANERLKNELADNKEGGFTKHIPSGNIIPIFEASELYKKSQTPLVIVAGKEYGSGSSRDWAAKGVMLLGVSAVIAESFERIHRSNLIGTGVLPLMLPKGTDRSIFNGTELITLRSNGNLSIGCKIECEITDASSHIKKIMLDCMILTKLELAYFSSGGILQYALADVEESQ